LILRRCFYRLTLAECSLDSHIGFGAIFLNRRSRVGSHAYVGMYVIAGPVEIGARTLVGNRTSFLGGKHQHELDAQGRWTPFDPAKAQFIHIAHDVWIGESAILMADVGPRSLIAAGTVVSTPVPAGCLVAGNPGRFVRKLEPAASSSPAATVNPVEAIS
jgi:acetyltransferase-like isoleucine patch superfamily enzyme